MSLETASYIHQLNPANPSGSDRLKDGDDHIRMLKAAIKQTFPGITGPLDASVTHQFLNALAGQLVPRGTITLFAGEAAPTGWWLCDGSTATLSDGSGTVRTPDLRGRVPVGADATHALGSLFGQTSKTYTTEAGGAHGHAATVASAGAHGHDVSGGTTSSSMTGLNVTAGTDKVDDGGSASNILKGPLAVTDPGHTHSITGQKAGEAGAHTHTAAIADAPGHAHGVTIDTTQPSIAVNFIIKV